MAVSRASTRIDLADARDARDPRRDERVRRRLRYDLLPLLRDYVDERLLRPATSEIEGLADRLEARLDFERDA